MTITLPEKLETKINQLFPEEKEREAFLAKNLAGLVEMLAVLNGQERMPRSHRVLEKARTQANRLRGEGVTKDEAFDRLREKVKKLEL